MSITEHQRNQLHNTLTDTLGTEDADTMMELLPPVGWADVATTRDIALVRNDIDHLGGQVGQLRELLGREVGQLRELLESEVGQVRDLLGREIGQVRRDFDNQLTTAVAQLRQEMAESRGQMHKDIAEVHRTVSRLTWTMTLGMLGSVIAAASFAFSAATFL